MINVNKGVIEFNIPAKPLSIFVCAFVNKKAGNVEPINPTINNERTFSLVIFLKYFIPKGKKVKNEINIRNAAT